jgi:hypothetical protein
MRVGKPFKQRRLHLLCKTRAVLRILPTALFGKLCAKSILCGILYGAM